MRTAITVACITVACMAAEPESTPLSSVAPATFSLGQTRVIQVTNVLNILQSLPIDSPCPECGGPNHHERQVVTYAIHSQTYQDIITKRGTNTILIDIGATNKYLGTNIVLRSFRTQPGWQTVPPLPVSTNH